MKILVNTINPLVTFSQLPILAIVTISLIPLFWFEGQAINGVDVDYAFFHQDRFFARLQLWDPNFMGGTPRSNNVASLGFILPSALLEYFGIIDLNQMIFYCAIQAAIGFSFYFFMRATFGRCETKEHAIALGAACVFYMTSFYLMFVWVRLQLGTTYLIFLPTFLGVLALGLEKKIRKSTLWALCCLLAIPSSPLGIQPPIIMIIVFFFLIYFIFQAVTPRDRNAFKEVISVWAVASLGFVAGSLFWAIGLISFIFEAGYNDSAVGKDVYSVAPLIEWTSTILNTQNLISFFGDIDWFGEWNGHFYFPTFVDHSLSYLGIFLPIIVFIIAIQSLNASTETNRGLTYVFFFCYCFFLFLSKGSHPPFGFIYLWLVENLPMFWIQRAPWQKFTLISNFCFTVLLFIAIRHLLIKFAILKRLAFSVKLSPTVVASSVFSIAVLAILANHHLYVSGKMFRSATDEKGFHGVYDLGFQHNYPEYLFDARQSIYKRGSKNILLLPIASTNVFTWNYGAATPISVLLFDQGLFFKSYGEGMTPKNKAEQILKTVEENILLGDVDGFLDALSILGIDTIIQRSDHRINFFKATKTTPRYMGDFLGDIDAHEKLESGEWDIYFLDRTKIKPTLYVPTAISSVHRPTHNLQDTILGAYSKDKSNGVFLSSISNSQSSAIKQTIFQKEFTKAVVEFSGDMNFRKISNSKYYVSIMTASPTIPLLLNTNFSDQWIIRNSQDSETNAYQSESGIFSKLRSRLKTGY